MHDKVFEIFSLLSNLNYTSGSFIGKKLNITRAAVWKNIQILRKTYFINIDSNSTKGYKLRDNIPLIDKNNIRSNLKDYNCKVEYFFKVRSTNHYLENSCDSNSLYHICVSEYQSHGQGRFNRTWYSPFAQNIYLSLKTVIEKDISTMSGIGIIVSVVTIKCLKYFFNTLDIKIKWPNDIYIKNRKVSGNLIHLKAESNYRSQIIIGIGINANMFGSKIDGNWTSLALETKKTINREKIILKLVKELIASLKIFESVGLNPFRKMYDKYDYMTSKKLVFTLPNKKIVEGIYKGIDSKGCLLISDVKTNKIQSFTSGEITTKYSF